MLELLNDPAVWASFFTLTILEIVLGVDNVIFISIAPPILVGPRSCPRRASLRISPLLNKFCRRSKVSSAFPSMVTVSHPSIVHSRPWRLRPSRLRLTSNLRASNSPLNQKRLIIDKTS